MGKRLHDENLQLLKKTHHEVLATVLGRYIYLMEDWNDFMVNYKVANSYMLNLYIIHSKEATADAMIYSYKHGFSGFAAKLTASQAKTISGFAEASLSTI